jgi:hypothetical protein
MKPIWHTGSWSEEQTQDLIEELRLAEQTRSLTNEEQHWLLTASLVNNLQKSPISN